MFSISAQAELVFKNDFETISQADAVRFLTQTSFGATQHDVDTVILLSYKGWIDEQMALDFDNHKIEQAVFNYNPDNYGLNAAWWDNAITGNNQLRNRVAYALSQILVVSAEGYELSNRSIEVASYYDLLRRHAFGNYRDLLIEVSRHPAMGRYLSSKYNSKAIGNIRPDENYARELLQLFTLGTHLLNPDGTVVLDAQDNPVKVYQQDQIKTFARVFTGWSLPGARYWLDNNPIHPSPVQLMFDFDSSVLSNGVDTYHDSDAKTLFTGDVLAANQSATEDLADAIDAVFAHQNIAPFISEQLIQRLVTSNPSRFYVSRIAQVFEDDGTGTKGNLSAVIKAILTDNEALFGGEYNDNFGKYKEPTLMQSQLMRLFHGIEVTSGIYSGHYDHGFLIKDARAFSQSPLRAPSVFNFYRPDHYASVALRDLGIRAPELQIYSEDVIAKILQSLEDNIQRFNTFTVDQLPWITAYPLFDFYPELERLNTEGVDALVDYLDLLLTANHLPPAVKQNMREKLGMAFTDETKKQAIRNVIKIAVFHPSFWIQY